MSQSQISKNPFNCTFSRSSETHRIRYYLHSQKNVGMY